MKFTFNLESKIAGLVVLLILGVYGVQTYIDYGNEVDRAERRRQDQASTIARTLNNSVVGAVRDRETELLKEIAQDLLDANPDLNQITITTPTGTELVRAIKDRKAETSPVSSPVTDRGAILATINVGFLTAPVREELRNSLKDKGITGLLVVGVAILFTTLLSRRVTHPLTVLTDAVSKVAAGDLAQKVTIKSHDEIGVLGRTFNQMTESLEQSHNELNRANSSLEKKVRELTTLFEIDKLINRSTGVSEVLRLTMEMMTTGFGVEMGAILLKARDGDHYRIVEAGGLGEATRAGHRLDPESGALAGVLALGEAMLIDNFTDNPELLAGFSDDERGRIGWLLTIPLKTGPNTLGVLNIYRLASGEKPDEELQHLFEIIVSLIAPLIQMTILFEEKMAAIANPFEPLAERIDQELARARKFNLPFSLALIAVPGLSRCCAARGYPAGMELMTRLQEVFLAEVPSAESVIRFGLNSFAVIQAGKDGAETRARMTAVLDRARGELPALAECPATVRVSSFPDHGAEALALIDALTAAG